jgi:hypothetical protein
MTTSNDSDDRLNRIEALVESNARAIAAMGERQEAADQQLREQLAATDELIKSSITDVVEMIGELGQRQAETDQRFNTLLAEGRLDRQSNRREHREFREFTRQTLQELRQIWQRIAS